MFAGNNIVKQFLHGMDSVRDFIRNVVASIPDDAGEDGANGVIKIPHRLENPSSLPRRYTRAWKQCQGRFCSRGRHVWVSEGV